MKHSGRISKGFCLLVHHKTPITRSWFSSMSTIPFLQDYKESHVLMDSKLYSSITNLLDSTPEGTGMLEFVMYWTSTDHVISCS